ncbi:MAG TPA: AI-2E family transporter, partial [Lachnospiraceae bacterium]|nr:AI-2E family transporter [Lachnospiraceae bacterium]
MRDFFKKLDKKYLKVACYASIALLVTFFVGLGLYQLGPSVAIGLKMVHAILSPLILGLVLCYLLYPI